MSKDAISLHDEEMENSILDPIPVSDQSQNLSDWSMPEDLSFNKICFKSVNNFLDRANFLSRHLELVLTKLRL